jgi:hypothetical protein
MNNQEKVIVYCHIDSKGDVTVQYGHSEESELLKEFKDEFPSHDVYLFETNNVSSEETYKAVAKSLWVEFSDTPTNEDDELDADFLHFKKGQDRHDVWHWFESQFDVSVAEDLMGLESGNTDSSSSNQTDKTYQLDINKSFIEIAERYGLDEADYPELLETIHQKVQKELEAIIDESIHDQLSISFSRR